MLKKTFMFVLAIVFVVSARDGQGAINFVVGIPQGDFQKSINHNGFGLGGHIAYHPHPAFAIGLAGTFLGYGSESRYEPFSTTIPDVTVEVTRTNNIAQLFLMLQAGIPIEVVKPYIEGRVGFNYLWTETTIKDIQGEEDVASSTNFDDLAFSYGGGGGIMFRVWHRRGGARRAHGKVYAVHIDAKALYILGGEAEYLKEGSIIIHDDATVEYIVSKSTTDLLDVHFGVVLEF